VRDLDHVQPGRAPAAADVEPGAPLEAELIEYCRERIAKFKCPVSVVFVDELPRLPTGKLLKRDLRERYAQRK
jgi:acyl-CoA synthetase (AMP-forming)/AMP-acid ligase II